VVSALVIGLANADKALLANCKIVIAKP